MLKCLYFTIVVSSSSSFFDALSLRSLNGSQPNLDTYLLKPTISKIWSEVPQAFTFHRLWAINRFFGTDFELWPNISLQRNMILKTCQPTGTFLHAPKVGELWFRNGWERLVSYCPPPKFLHWQTLPALPHRRYITDSRKTLAHVV